MLPIRFDQTKPFLTLGLALVAWLVLPVVFKSVLRVSFFEMQAPVDTAVSYTRDLQDFWSLRNHSKNELIEAGRDLARLNASYELKVQENAALHAEIGHLEGLLRLPSFENYRAEPARVARRDFSSWWQRLIIRKGSNYGLTVGAPVIFTGGVVGRVSEVHAYTAVVDLISSPEVRLAATLEDDTRPISYQGALSPSFGPARGVVEFVPLDIFMLSNQTRRLVTSGLGGVFPAGLVIGTLTKVNASADGLFNTGEVQLDPRLAELTEVTVLVPLGPTEAKPTTP
ncbi:MAG TPA: rod shape-determining protein MreC [Opitutaceae bacterium]|nr:rod shape-determining protein MreC [Opitutaceae bacterium]